MLAFPSMPEWETDELAGNYFSRIARENGVRFRHTFMSWLGFKKNNCGAQIMDISDLTPSWVQLAEKLGIGLDDMVGQLSTKPYWVRFYRLPSSEIEAPSPLPAAQALLFAMSHTLLQLRICPACLADDYKTPKCIPILRRSHQLPGSLVCHMHGVVLLNRCPGCDKVLVPRMELVHLPLRCESCGYDLGSHVGTRPGDLSPFIHLARFEHECLNSHFAPRPASEVAGFIAHTCQVREIRPIDLLRKKFGPLMNSWRRSSTLPDQIHLSRENMPTLCACLVALGFTYEAADKAIGQSDPRTDATRKKNAQIKSTSQARRIVLAKMRSGERVTWKSLQQGSRYLFWFFVLVDLRWLEGKIGSRPRAELRVPSVTEDRETLCNSVSNHRDEACARASYRDREWLEAMRSDRHKEISEQRTLARDAALRTSIGSAMAGWFARPGRPIKFTLEHAAAAVGMMRGRVLALNRREPQGTDILFESIRHFHLRVLLWAMNELTKQEKVVTPSRLLSLARVGFGTMEYFWAASIVYLFSSTKRGDSS
ncbi:TniQ family protein [Variovorax paradoxus]|nr:TniQ family protein [Variovorax paradoxus]